jgi:hypothetical protein
LSSFRHVERHSRRDLAEKVVNLDFDARVPIPFSIFPSSYRSDDKVTTTETHVEGEIKLPGQQRVGREGQSSSLSATLPPQDEQDYQQQEEVHITREEERYHRPSRREDITVREETVRPVKQTSTRIDVELPHIHRPHLSNLLPHRPHLSDILPHHRPRYDTEVDIKVEQPRRRQPQQQQPQYETEIDINEREYRSRFQPRYREEVRINQTTVNPPPRYAQSTIREDIRVNQSTVDPPRFQPQTFREEVKYSQSTVDPPRHIPAYREEVRITGTTVDPPTRFQQPERSEIRVTEQTVDPPRQFKQTKRESVRVVEETVEPPRYSQPIRREQVRVSKKTVEPPTTFKPINMGYYDEDGRYHSFRHGLHRAADRVFGRGHHHHYVDREEINIATGGRDAAPAPEAAVPNTVTIPCHHIRTGDLLILQGRPCQVIRITTSGATGQHRYLGVDLFTKQLHEESSFISNPSPSVVVQTMLGPVFKQYRVLDLQDGTVVAMTETGDVKQAIPVIDQSDLWNRLSKAFESGRGSVRILVISDNGRELAVDMKVIQGSRL